MRYTIEQTGPTWVVLSPTGAICGRFDTEAAAQKDADWCNEMTGCA